MPVTIKALAMSEVSSNAHGSSGQAEPKRREQDCRYEHEYDRDENRQRRCRP